MEQKKTIRIDQAVIAAAVCLIGGFLLGLFTANLLSGGQTQSAPVATQQMAPPPASAPWQPTAGIEAKITELEKIVQTDPSNLRGWINLGNAYFDTGKHQESVEAYTRALEIDPNNPDVTTDRGIMYKRLGDPLSAVEDFRKAAEMDPSHINSMTNLGVVLFHDLGDKEGAIEAWEGAISRNPPPEMAERLRNQIEALKNMPENGSMQ